MPVEHVTPVGPGDALTSTNPVVAAAPTTFAWVTTSPNPRHPGTGHDAGQRGWRLHAVPMAENEEYLGYKRRYALCGLSPRHGWGLDLFIEDECTRCQGVMTKREAAGESFLDLAEVAKAKRRAREAQETLQYEALGDDDE